MSFWQNRKNKKFIRENSFIVDKSREFDFKKLSEEDLKKDFISLANNFDIRNNISEALAYLTEQIFRITGIALHDNQLLASLAIFNGKIAEMATGEGKTLSAIVASGLVYLTGNKTHIFTANDYLVERDAVYSRSILGPLGINVKFINQSIDFSLKKEMYQADILYLTAREACFDLLNQQFIKDINENFNIKRDFAIIDEVDYILIEEARSSIALSSNREENSNKYIFINDLKHAFDKDVDFSVDIKKNRIDFLDKGYEKLEFLSKKYDLISENESIYDDNHLYLIKLFNNALKAEFLFLKNKHYLVQDEKIVIVDQSSGRVLYGRRWGDGLDQAIEAKESIQILPETNTVARTTLQFFFQKYRSISGMTGTAITEAIEFKEIYSLDVIQIHSNKNLARIDYNDIVYQTKENAVKAIVNYIKEHHSSGRPILVGTLSVDDSETIYNAILKEGFNATILNAKNHKNESIIIQNAGILGSITIATNMAGRGTDIMLGGFKDKIIDEHIQSGMTKESGFEKWTELHDEVENLGGLLVIGFERSHSRRLDNQLIGRSGRQGDKGSSIFFVTLEDDLIRGYGTQVHVYVKTIGLKSNDIGVSDKKVSEYILTAQQRNENDFFNMRKDIIRYSHIVEDQSEIVANIRENILNFENIEEYNSFIKNVYEKVVNDLYLDVNSEESLFLIKNEEPNSVEDAISEIFSVDIIDLEKIAEENISSDESNKHAEFGDLLFERFMGKQQMFSQYLEGSNVEVLGMYKKMALMIIDGIWCDHLSNIDAIKKQTQFSNFSKNNPIQVFGEEVDDAFVKTLRQIFLDIAYGLYMFKPEDLNITT